MEKIILNYKKPPRHGPGQLAVGVPACPRWLSNDFPSNNSVILWKKKIKETKWPPITTEVFSSNGGLIYLFYYPCTCSSENVGNSYYVTLVDWRGSGGTTKKKSVFFLKKVLQRKTKAEFNYTREERRWGGNIEFFM